MHERQAVIFGVLLAVLAVAGLGAAAVYTDNLALPLLDRGFSTNPTESAAPVNAYCPPEGALPVPNDQITVNVLNGSGQNGLAAATAASLTERSFTVGATGNGAPTAGVARITHGIEGTAQAYTLLAYVPGAELFPDARTDATVDLVLGDEYERLAAPEEIALEASTPLEGVTGCRPFAEITATPTAVPTEAPAEG